jgi:reactive chlorine resistance protein C
MTSRIEAAAHHAPRIEAVGTAILRYGVVFLLATIGALKFADFEAKAIQPLVSNSPFMGWLYAVLSVQGVSNLIGTTEIITAALIASRRLSPTASAAGSALGVVIFATTLSFLFTTPGGLSPRGPAFGFLVKDVVLLGASIYARRGAVRRRCTARRHRAEPRRPRPACPERRVDRPAHAAPEA